MSGPFKLGDAVQWTSQSAGFAKKKVGLVAAVVPPGKSPSMYAPWGTVLRSIPGMPRDHETYLVSVGESTRLYWPRASLLRNVEAEATLQDLADVVGRLPVRYRHAVRVAIASESAMLCPSHPMYVACVREVREAIKDRDGGNG